MLFCESLCLFEDLLWDALNPCSAVCVPHTLGHKVASQASNHQSRSSNIHNAAQNNIIVIITFQVPVHPINNLMTRNIDVPFRNLYQYNYACML